MADMTVEDAAWRLGGRRQTRGARPPHKDFDRG